MAILHFQESSGTFEFDAQRDLGALARETADHLFSDAAHHIIKGFVDPEVAGRIRDFYTRENPLAFRSQRSPIFTFHGQGCIVYYPRSPYVMPRFIASAYRQISLFRNMVYADQDFYINYCAAFHLDPHHYEAVFEHQAYHTWARLSWYQDHDGQCAHRDNYGEIAAFLILTKKGVHWKQGGLFFYDEDGNRTTEVDALCEPGDLLFLDQHKVIHAVEPILGAAPGRLLFYVPIIPSTYMKPWYTFEGHPWNVFYSQARVTLIERLGATAHNAFNNLTGRSVVHYSRKYYPHATLELSPANEKATAQVTYAATHP